jgi:hypothetical protein
MRLPLSRGRLGSVREVPLTIPSEDEEPTAPWPVPVSQKVPVARDSSLTVPSLTKGEAGQLAGIIAAWENASPSDRLLLAEFAKLLQSGSHQRKTLREVFRRAEAGAPGTRKVR